MDIDVTGLVTANSTVNLALTSSTASVANFSSREVADLAPALTVTFTDTTAPAAPVGVSAVDGDGSVGLAWSANTEADLAAYRAYRRVTGGTWPSSPTKDLTGTSWTDTTAVNSTSYDYRVTAVDTAGNESTPSPVVSATPRPTPDTTAPAAPVGGSAVAGDGSVGLAWSANTEADLAAYRAYRRVTGGSWPSSPTKDLTGTSWTDTTAVNSTSYDYRVTAVDTGLVAYWRLGDRTGTTACEARERSPGTTPAATPWVDLARSPRTPTRPFPSTAPTATHGWRTAPD